MEISWSSAAPPATDACAVSPSPAENEPVSEPHTHPPVKGKAGKAGGGASVSAAAAERERKRLRHRQYVKKSYNKKINTLATLKSELERLELQYNDMLAQHTADSKVDLTPSSASPALRKYLLVTELKNRYRAENQMLYEANAGFMKAEDRLGQLVDAETQPPNVPRFHVTPLPEAEYAKVIAEARDDVINFAYGREKLSSGARVLGWTDQRKIQGKELKFGLEKEFPGLSALELLQRSWAIFSSPEEFPKIYGAQIKVEFHVLQHVNDDTVLFYRTIRSPAVDRVVKCVFLLARVRIDQGYMMLFRSIDKDLVQFREDEIAQILEEVRSMSSAQPSEALTHASHQEIWVDKYIWVLFHDRGRSVGGSDRDKSCLFHFGGSTTTTIWLQEVLFIALRWESMAVGPVFTITSG